ncbi:E3 ubiquitin-protein ligase PHF7 [Ciona intestinalis]
MSETAKVSDDNPQYDVTWWKQLRIKKVVLPDSCIFCNSSVDCEDKHGEYLQHNFSGMKLHYFCLLLASGLNQTIDVTDCTTEKDSIYGFMVKDIVAEYHRASRLRCSFCHKKGASIGCAVPRCKVKFHHPCAEETVSQFYDQFPSFCKLHRPKQIAGKKGGTTTCPVCLDTVCCSVETISSLKTPCCHDVWMHRVCVQQHANSSGLHFFRCPVCNDGEIFTEEMRRMGIHIPERDAAWEMTHDAFTDLLHRHAECDVDDCVCPHGRDFSLKGSEWAVVLCDLCGSFGTHIGCHDDVDCENSYYACSNCERIHGREGAREIAVAMGVIIPEVKRTRRSERIGAPRSKRARLTLQLSDCSTNNKTSKKTKKSPSKSECLNPGSTNYDVINTDSCCSSNMVSVGVNTSQVPTNSTRTIGVNTVFSCLPSDDVTHMNNDVTALPKGDAVKVDKLEVIKPPDPKSLKSDVTKQKSNVTAITSQSTDKKLRSNHLRTKLRKIKGPKKSYKKKKGKK